LNLTIITEFEGTNVLKNSLFLLVFLLSNIISISYLYTIYNDNKKSMLTNKINELSHLYQSSLTIYRSNAKLIFDNIIMQPEVLSILEEIPKADKTKTKKLHYELYNILKDRYFDLRQSLNIRQIQFHYSDGRSFLRMNRPDQYGDSLLHVRYSIKIVNTEKKYIEGFEEGRTFNGYRYVYPIIYNNLHLGSVEISVSMDAIINQLSKIFITKSFYLMIDKKIMENKLFSSEQSNYMNSEINRDFLIDKEVYSKLDNKYKAYIQKLNTNDMKFKISEHQPMVETISLKNNVVASFLPLYNIENIFVAYLVSFEENDHFVNNENKFLYQLLFLMFFSIIILSIVYFIMEQSSYIKKEKEILDILVLKRTKELQEAQKEIVKSYRDIILAMVNLTEMRDAYTAGHTKRVAEYSKLIAIKMGYSSEDVELLYDAAILHDIGKIVTPDSVLLKPASLNLKEFDIIKQHVVTGSTILSEIKLYENLVDIVKHHHEHYDGSGYPDGLRSDEIPPLSRIIAVADAFDAMTTNRIYKPRKDLAVALEELKSLSGIYYEPNVVIAAVEVLQNIQINLDITQWPNSTIEEERLSQFFKDPLTHLYNLKYLQIILKYASNEQQYTCANIVSIENFTKFNNTHGWEEGDVILIKLSNCLLDMFSKSMVFRIYGDDFVILNSVHITIDKEEIENKFKNSSKYPIELNIRHYDIENDNDRNNLIRNLENEIG